MKKYLLYIFILQISKVLSNYTHELIDEMIQKSVIFEKCDFDSFKIFKYIPLCKGKINWIKQVYLQISNEDSMYLYIYDNYSKIEQDKDADFINYKGRKILYSFNSFALNLTCQKDYYFIVSNAIKTPSYYCAIRKVYDFNIEDFRFFF